MITAYQISRDAVWVSGPEAATYLQGQLSQDVESLAVGESARSFVLQPTGKVDSWVRVTRTDDETFLLDVDPGFGPGLTTRLQRFLLRTRAEVRPADGLVWLALRGEGAATAAGEVGGADAWRLPAGRSGDDGVDVVDLAGGALTPPADVREGTADEYEAARIVAGVPAMGSELTEQTIPAEVGQWVIDRSVSFTKGCFTGQELVARIDSRGGNVPRRLRGIVPIDGALPSPGAAVQVDGADVGVVTSVATTSDGGTVGLGFVRRAVDVPVDGLAVGAEGEVKVGVRSLPLDETS